MIVHNGFKIISDMPKFIFYLFENFKGEMLASGIWPKTNQEQIIYIFEWYASKLRPFMWEFYGIMTATNQAGLTNTNEDDMPVFDAQEGVEADSAEMIAKREVGRFRQVKSKTDACLLEWWRDKGSVARDRAGGVVWGWLSKLARRAA